jgi:hypothetical protein
MGLLSVFVREKAEVGAPWEDQRLLSWAGVSGDLLVGVVCPQFCPCTPSQEKCDRSFKVTMVTIVTLSLS